jgi:nicotinate-nucleotide adenylyltransferase
VGTQLHPQRRIGILGGTFDPVHCGHLDMGDAAALALGLTRVYVLTANVPPHRPQPLASSFHRFAMVSMAVAGRPGWRASELEVRFEPPSYTSTTLRRFRERGFAPHELFFVLGADAFADIEAWHDYPAILTAANFAVVARPGFPVDEMAGKLPRLAARMVRAPVEGASLREPAIVLIGASTAGVSSTAIRQHRAAGESIAGLVPPSVQQHIEQHGLYTAVAPGRRALDSPAPPAPGRLNGQD